MLTAGLGGMGGAQPLAATMQGAAFLAVEVDRVAHREALSRRATATEDAQSLDEALAWIEQARAAKQPLSVASWATPPRCCPSSCAAA